MQDAAKNWLLEFLSFWGKDIKYLRGLANFKENLETLDQLSCKSDSRTNYQKQQL